MKGIIFAGCSFTWGHGLWYYSELENMPYGDQHLHLFINKSSYSNIKDVNRFPRLVSKHFNTYEVVKRFTAGSEDTSFQFLKQIFDINEGENSPTLSIEKYNFNEIEYLIFQTSSPDRNDFKIEIDGEIKSFNCNDLRRNKKIDLLYKNGIKDFEDFYELLVKQCFDNIKSNLEFYESKGIKCFLLCWTEDYLPHIINDKWVNDRFIPLEYDNKSYDCINHLFKEYQNLIIINDKEFFGENTPKDEHPSKKCHQIIAESIIKKIEQYEKINQLA
jgi:hypothetical protein